MYQSIEISEKLLKELEKKRKSPEDSIENLIWNLIEQLNFSTKNAVSKTNTKNNISPIWRNKTLKDVFG